MRYYPCHNCQTVNDETSMFCRGCGKVLQTISPNDFESLLQRIKSERLDGDIETAMFNNQLGVEWGVTSLKNHSHSIKTKYAYELPIKDGITLIQNKDYSCVNSVSLESEINIYDYIRADVFKYFNSNFSFEQTIRYFQQFPNIVDIEPKNFGGFSNGRHSIEDIFYQFSDIFGRDFKEKISLVKISSWLYIRFRSFSMCLTFEGFSAYECETLKNVSISYHNAPKQFGIGKLFWQKLII